MSLYLGDKEMSVYVGDVLVSGSSGPKCGYVDVLVVGGGGGGGAYLEAYSTGAGGGGAGGYIECLSYLISNENIITVYVGSGGAGGTSADRSYDGGYSSFGDLCALGGGGGSGNGVGGGNSGGSGGGSGWYRTCGGGGTQGQGNNGGNSNGCTICHAGGGGGGAGGVGGNAGRPYGGNGGIGKCSCISGECKRYSGGGSGGGTSGDGQAGCGGAVECCYGGGGDGHKMNGWNYGNGSDGYQGVVYVRYPSDGSSGIKSATGGCKYTCGNYTIHRFANTSDTEYFSFK